MARWWIPLSLVTVISGVGGIGLWQGWFWRGGSASETPQVAAAGEKPGDPAQPPSSVPPKPIPIPPDEQQIDSAPRPDPFRRIPSDSAVVHPAPRFVPQPPLELAPPGGAEGQPVGVNAPLAAEPMPIQNEPTPAGPMPGAFLPPGDLRPAPANNALAPSNEPTPARPSYEMMPAGPPVAGDPEPAARINPNFAPTPRDNPAPLVPVAPTPLGPNAYAPAPAPEGRVLAPANPGSFVPPADIHASPTGSAGGGRPGAKEWDGPQAPTLIVEKVAPQEIQVGKPAKFEVRVRNTGKAAAQQVVIRDEIPQGTRLIDSTPAVTPDASGALVWSVPSLGPGDETIVSYRLLPESEGEIGSVATVSFQTPASVRTVCTRPVLSVEHVIPQKVLIGSDVPLKIRVTNTGTGAASNVILQEDVPDGLTHPAGHQLEYEVGFLKPGETRELDLVLKAAKAGVVRNVITARGEANLFVEHRAEMEVIAPRLTVGIDGPKRRFLDRPATYQITLANPGTAPAKDVELAAWLPKGLKFVSTNNAGVYDPKTHAVYWSLAELPADKQGTVELVAVPQEMGEQKLRIEAKGAMNLSAVQEQPVTIEGLVAISFEVADEADPIEVGRDAVYEIRVINQGSKTATDLRVIANVPAGMKPLSGDGPTRGQVVGSQIIFEPLPRLAPKSDAIYKVRVQGIESGDHRLSVQVQSADLQTPVTKEESTRVYSDR